MVLYIRGNLGPASGEVVRNLPDGTATQPSIAYYFQKNTGIYRNQGNLNVTIEGQEYLSTTKQGIFATGNVTASQYLLGNGAYIVGGNASLLTQGTLSNDLLPSTIGDLQTSFIGDATQLTNVGLDLHRTEVVSVTPTTSISITTDTLVTAYIQQVNVWVNGIKLAYVDENAADYTLSSVTQDLANVSTTFVIDFTAPLSNGDVIDVLLKTSKTINESANTQQYYDTVYANTIQVSDITFGGNSVLTNSDVEVIFASGNIAVADGTVTSPSFTFDTSNSSGMYLSTEGVSISNEGTHVASFGPSITISSNLVPSQGNVYSLGNATHRFQSLYLEGNTIDLGGLAIKNTGNTFQVGDVTLDGSALVSDTVPLQFRHNGYENTYKSGDYDTLIATYPVGTEWFFMYGQTHYKARFEATENTQIRGTTFWKLQDGGWTTITSDGGLAPLPVSYTENDQVTIQVIRNSQAVLLGNTFARGLAVGGTVTANTAYLDTMEQTSQYFKRWDQSLVTNTTGTDLRWKIADISTSETQSYLQIEFYSTRVDGATSGLFRVMKDYNNALKLYSEVEDAELITHLGLHVALYNNTTASTYDLWIEVPSYSSVRFVVQYRTSWTVYKASTRVDPPELTSTAPTGTLVHTTSNPTISKTSEVITNTNTLSFGSSVRQMLNLFNNATNNYGIGVQNSTLYCRSQWGFAWHRGGVHDDTQNAPGTGGSLAMLLDSSSNLTVSGTVSSSSDDRLKHNEEYITNAIGTLQKLKPQIYQKSNEFLSTSPDDPVESGLIVQEVWYDAPELRHLVSIPDDANPAESILNSTDPSIDPDYTTWGSTPASFNYIGLIPYLIKGLQEQQSRLDAMETRLAALESG